MATLDQAPEQLRAWIKELDDRLEALTTQRGVLAQVLEALDGVAPPPIAKGMPARLQRPVDPDAREEHRRQRDAERQRRNRAGIKQPKGSPGTSKYDYAEVARIANAAARAGVAPGRAVADRYKVSPQNGAFLVAQARKRGHDIPKLGANKPIKMTAPAKAPASNVTPIAGSRGFTPANCIGMDPELFFPERGQSTREARECCRRCDVQAECLAYALNNDEKFGIWGGTSERQRRAMRRQRPKRVAA